MKSEKTFYYRTLEHCSNINFFGSLLNMIWLMAWYWLLHNFIKMHLIIFKHYKNYLTSHFFPVNIRNKHEAKKGLSLLHLKNERYFYWWENPLHSLLTWVWFSFWVIQIPACQRLILLCYSRISCLTVWSSSRRKACALGLGIPLKSLNL